MTTFFLNYEKRTVTILSKVSKLWIKLANLGTLLIKKYENKKRFSYRFVIFSSSKKILDWSIHFLNDTPLVEEVQETVLLFVLAILHKLKLASRRLFVIFVTTTVIWESFAHHDHQFVDFLFVLLRSCPRN